MTDHDEDDEPDRRARPARRTGRPGCVASATIQIANVAIEPTIAGSGISAPRIRTLNGARYGRSRSGSVDPQLDHRQLGGGEREQDAEREEAREERDVVAGRTTSRSTIADETTAAETIACGETCARRLSRPKLRGSCPCSPSE